MMVVVKQDYGWSSARRQKCVRWQFRGASFLGGRYPQGGNCLTFGCSGGEMISATAAAAAARGTRELCADKSLDGLAAWNPRRRRSAKRVSVINDTEMARAREKSTRRGHPSNGDRDAGVTIPCQTAAAARPTSGLLGLGNSRPRRYSASYHDDLYFTANGSIISKVTNSTINKIQSGKINETYLSQTRAYLHSTLI